MYVQQMLYRITLHFFNQPSTCLLAQGVQHHSQLSMRALIRNQVQKPGSLTYGQSFKETSIACNFPKGMVDTKIFSSGHRYRPYNFLGGKGCGARAIPPLLIALRSYEELLNPPHRLSLCCTETVRPALRGSLTPKQGRWPEFSGRDNHHVR